jgi:CheY-like chemotaxis protein
MNTILVVDDEPKMRTVIRRILERAGFDVLEAAHGDEGLDMYQHHSPAVVLMDIVMPEKDGLSAIREIRKIDSQAKIIAVSGGLVFTPSVYLDEAVQAGAQCAIEKPIEPDSLISAIENVLHPCTNRPVSA